MLALIAYRAEKCRHARGSGHPGWFHADLKIEDWIPACAGMTEMDLSRFPLKPS
jgi:hypothetical protein